MRRTWKKWRTDRRPEAGCPETESKYYRVFHHWWEHFIIEESICKYWIDFLTVQNRPGFGLIKKEKNILNMTVEQLMLVIWQHKKQLKECLWNWAASLGRMMRYICLDKPLRNHWFLESIFCLLEMPELNILLMLLFQSTGSVSIWSEVSIFFEDTESFGQHVGTRLVEKLKKKTINQTLKEHWGKIRNVLEVLYNGNKFSKKKECLFKLTTHQH